MTSKSSKVNFSEVLPDDEKIIGRNLAWRRILERYSQAASGDDEEGVLISDFVQHYPTTDDISSDEGSASDISEDDNSCSDSSDDDLEENRLQLAVAVKARTNQWKVSGLVKIFEDNFSLGTKEAMDWLQHCKVGQGKAMEREQETRFTEIDGDKTIDVSCKRNVSFLNQEGAQKLTSINNSNYELKNGTGRRIIFQQTERTLTTVFDENGGSTMDLCLPSSILSFPNLNVNNISSILQNLSAAKPKPTRKVTFKPAKPPKKSNRNDQNNRSRPHLKIEMVKEKPPKPVANNQNESIVISSTDSDSDGGGLLSPEVTRKPVKQKQVTFKPQEPTEKDHQKAPNNRPELSTEVTRKPVKQKQVTFKPLEEPHRKSRPNAPNDRSLLHKQKAPENALKQVDNKQVVIFRPKCNNNREPLNSENIAKPFSQKQTNVPKPTASCDASQNQNTNSTRTSQQNVTVIKKKNPINEDSSTVVKVKSNGQPSGNCSDSNVPLISSVKPKKHVVATSASSKAKQQPNSGSDESRVKSKSGPDTTLHKSTVKTERSFAKKDPTGKPPIAAPTETKPAKDQQYYMTESMKAQLQIGGRFRYRLQGMVIYRPKQIKHGAPATERIRITHENLDLGAIADEKKKQKFNNFLYSIHPNSTIVYYMSEDEEEPPEAKSDAEDSESEDEDDPILKFRPKVCVFEIPYESPSV